MDLDSLDTYLKAEFFFLGAMFRNRRQLKEIAAYNDLNATKR